MNCAAWPEATASAPTPPSSGGDPLLEGGGGRVHDPGVDVAEALQGEELGGVVGVLEDVRGRLVDRHRPGAGGGVGPLPGVDRQRGEAEDVVVVASAVSTYRCRVPFGCRDSVCRSSSQSSSVPLPICARDAVLGAMRRRSPRNDSLHVRRLSQG